MQAVDHFLGDAHQIFDQEWLDDKFFNAVDQGAQALFDIGAAGHEQKRNVAGFFAAAQLIEKLTAIHAGHFVVGKNNVGRIVDRF